MSYAGQKRLGDGGGALVPAKRPRQDLVPVSGHERNVQVMLSGPPRSSSLQAPIMQLIGHEAGVLSGKFSPTGGTLASASIDRHIFLWNVYGDCDNYTVMKGHSGAIMEIQYSTDGTMLFSCSVDKTGAVWDCEVGERIKKLKGHSSFVNTCCPVRRGVPIVATGSDDGNIKVWDIRKKSPAHTLNNTYQVTSVCFNDTGEQVISGGLDNDIKVWDMRRNEVVYTMTGHTDTVTGLSLSPNGYYVLSNGMDDTVRVWDVRPFAPADRQLKVFVGHQHGFEKNLLRCAWSPDGRKVAAGSADRFVYIWDAISQRMVYKLPGHLGSVNDVDFHPNEPISVCGSSQSMDCPTQISGRCFVQQSMDYLHTLCRQSMGCRLIQANCTECGYQTIYGSN